MSDPSARLVDLRSDTVTKPTAGMRAAMADAEVGDDVYGEDPTVAALERRVAGLFAKPAAVFVPSGTMANQIAIRLLVEPGQELICDADAHIVSYEGAAAADFGHLQTRTVVAARGLLDPASLAAQLRAPGWGMPATAAVSVEQTHNRGGGAVHPMTALRDLRGLLDGAATADWRPALHCDGARIWHASVADGVELAEYGALFEAISVALSKGLGAPVGSLVLCDEQQAVRARLLRRRLGGGMRQAGILAAAGIYALEHHVDRLVDDHRRARQLAEAVHAVAPSVVTPESVRTNIVMLDTAGAGWDSAALVAAAGEAGVLIGSMDRRLARAVTHLDVDDAGLERAVEVLVALLGRG